MADAATENPLAPPSEAQLERQRQRAYFLWQEDSCPDGRADEYWERARELLAMGDHPGAGLLSAAAGEPAVDEAALQDNLGEFPDRLSDQGEHRATPMTRDAERAWAEQA